MHRRKTITIGKQHKELEVGEELDQVAEIVCLGGLITEDGHYTNDFKKKYLAWLQRILADRVRRGKRVAHQQQQK